MKNTQKGFIPIIILIIILAAGVGGGAYYYYHKTKQETVSDDSRMFPDNINGTDATSSTSSVIAEGNTSQKKADIQTLPKEDQVFTLGDMITIQWDPSIIDVSTMYLVKYDPKAKLPPQYQIYHRESLSETVSSSGKYNYKLPNNFLIDSGVYQIELVSYGEKQKILLPHTFLIQVPEGSHPRTQKPYYISSINGNAITSLNNTMTYKPGNLISVTIDGREGDSSIALPQNGFNIQGHISRLDGAGITAENASYNSLTKLWTVKLPAPQESGKYTFEVQLYCGNIGFNSLCVQKYGENSNKSATFNFTVTQ